jgi:hypothetical protein
MKRLLLLTAGLVLILAGVVNFAAFESHIVKIRAHVETATYTSPDDIDFGTVFPQEVIKKWCGTDHGPSTTLDEGSTESGGGGGDLGNCVKIMLSKSFLDQHRVKDVEYKIYCEGPSKDGGPCTAGTEGCIDGHFPPKPDPQAITPYIQLFDSDKDTWTGDIDKVSTKARNCYPVKYPGNEWGQGSLERDKDKVDWWDLTLYVPVCKGNFNEETDPGQTPEGIPGVVEKCQTGPDSYSQVDLEGAIKFQVTRFSYGCHCAGEAGTECTCEESE